MGLKEDLARVQAEHGPWTAHPVQLPGGLCTMPQYNENHILYLRRTVQIAADMLGGDLSGRRVLDLACLEGGFSVEFAMQGASVVAVEGRQHNLAKLEFVRQALGLSNIQTVLGDVRGITARQYGTFDCVLCLGILYHLDRDSLGGFLKNLCAMTGRVLIVDTHVSLYGGEQVKIAGARYEGATYAEHGQTDTPEQIASRSWASLDNRNSFFLTYASLLNLLKDLGFSSVYLCEMPFYDTMADRRTIVALKGEPRRLRSVNGRVKMSDAYPEKPSVRVVTPINAPRT